MTTAALPPEGMDRSRADGHDGRALARKLLDAGVGSRHNYRDLEAASCKVSETTGDKPISTTGWYRLAHPESEPPKKHPHPVAKLRMITETLVYLGADITFDDVNQANGTHSVNSRSPAEKNLKLGAPTLDVMMSVIKDLSSDDRVKALLDLQETLTAAEEDRFMLGRYQRKAAKTGESPSDTDGPGHRP